MAWPIRNKGQLGRWSIGRETLLDLAEKGMAKVGSFNKKRRTFALSYLSDKLQAQVESGFLEIVDRDPETGVLDVRYIDEKDRRIKTVWHRSSHDAGAGGSDLLEELIGERRFDYPKSVYSVADTLGSIVGDNPDALILDFFAGSGTTLHATWLLNAEDDGRRRCVLVTNNEVTAKTQERLKDAGHLPGDEAWEAEGVFQAVTTKRVTAAISGATEDGVKLDGDYRGGRLRELGFPERVEYFDLTYMDPDLVDLGESFSAIHPCLWLMAGGIGELPSPVDPSHPYLIREDSNYAVLFDEDKFAEFVPLIGAHEAISHVWLVTDEESIFASMAERLPVGVESAMLYSSYLENFRIGAGGVG